LLVDEAVPMWLDPRCDAVFAQLLEEDAPATEPPPYLEMHEAAVSEYTATPDPVRRQRTPSPSTGERRLLDIREVAELLGCSRSYVYVLLRSAEIRSLKVGKLTRVPLDAVSEFIDRKLREADGRGRR
jgi:excisionase family DNA binding protein